jgi:hypothetical protein
MHASKADLTPTIFGDYVQTLEPVELIELSPVRAHDVTLAAITRNLAAATT